MMADRLNSKRLLCHDYFRLLGIVPLSSGPQFLANTGMPDNTHVLKKSERGKKQAQPLSPAEEVCLGTVKEYGSHDKANGSGKEIIKAHPIPSLGDPGYRL
jgi:hypothetical protein